MMRILWLAILSLLPMLAQAQVQGVPLISTTATGVISATTLNANVISTSNIYVSSSTYVAQAGAQITAYLGVMTVRTTATGSFSLANGASKVVTASCNAGELATGGGCSDTGYKIFWKFVPTASDYSCGWYNTSGATISGISGTVTVNCLQ